MNDQAQDQAQEPTQELRPLPEGSTVIQCVLEDGPEGPNIVINGIIIGGIDYDETNACHRFLTAIADRLPDIMAEVNQIAIESNAAANDDAATAALAAG